MNTTLRLRGRHNGDGGGHCGGCHWCRRRDDVCRDSWSLELNRSRRSGRRLPGDHFMLIHRSLPLDHAVHDESDDGSWNDDAARAAAAHDAYPEQRHNELREQRQLQLEDDSARNSFLPSATLRSITRRLEACRRRHDRAVEERAHIARLLVLRNRCTVCVGVRTSTRWGGCGVSRAPPHISASTCRFCAPGIPPTQPRGSRRP